MRLVLINTQRVELVLAIYKDNHQIGSDDYEDMSPWYSFIPVLMATWNILPAALPGKSAKMVQFTPSTCATTNGGTVSLLPLRTMNMP